ncbi:putative bactericidal permeability-increasing protein [Apostichopus japonicus]|uniref:Putative bactericidal permeability-increasing protein n=1 Tax=Stichopus japonicus TaxID=307972 RepID=A0A2G8LMM2_STIJA|nr:putative bactericidal permeability-increasing protein [Apostichopus japonicus]
MEVLTQTRIIVCLLVTLVGIGAVTLSTQPGFEARITQNGLNFLRDVGVAILKQKITSLTIPDQSGKASSPIGHIKYELKGMRVTSFDIPSSTITTKPGVGLTVSLNGVSLSVHGDWKYKYHFVSDHGSFDLSVSAVDASVTIHLALQPIQRRAHSIQKSMNKEVCTAIVKEINEDLEQEVSTLKVNIPFNDVAEIDYSLVAPPVFNTSINTAHKGEVYDINHHSEAPGPIPAIPSDPEDSRMFYMWITDYLANSAGYVLHNTGFLTYNVTQDNLPTGKISLNTSEFPIANFLPEITKQYPGRLMQINLNTTSPPYINTLAHETNGTIEGDIAAYVVQPDNSLTYLFTLGVNLSLGVTVSINKTNLVWNATYGSADLSIVSSAMKDLPLKQLQGLFPLVCRAGLIPALNRKGESGIPLPSVDGYTFKSSSITYGEGFMKISTDLAQEEHKLRFKPLYK